MEQEQKQVVSKEYSEHFLQLRAKGNWQMHMEGVTHLTSTLASPGVFARQNLLYLESIVLYHNTPAGFFVHRKNYNSYQIVFTLSGTGCLVYEGKEYRMTAGDCFLIDCRREHHYFTAGEEDWIHHGVQFNGHQMSAFFDYLVQLNAVVVALENTSKVNRIHEELASAASSKLASADIIINQLLTDLLGDIILCNQLTSDTQLSAKVAQICSFIDEHYAAIHSIDDIAENCFISKYYMCREFKRQTGKTVGSYLSERRMTAAKELLLHTDRNVSAIARDTGFEAENYFFFVFKKAEGLTPLQYRKQFKQLDPQ